MRISKIIWGLLFVLVGIVCLLSVFGVIPWADNISWTDFLPLVLAVLGLTWLIDSNVRFMGVVFLAIGVYWTLQNLGVFDVSVGKIMIPVLLVALGVSILTPPRKKYRRGSAGGRSGIRMLPGYACAALFRKAENGCSRIRFKAERLPRYSALPRWI